MTLFFRSVLILFVFTLALFTWSSCSTSRNYSCNNGGSYKKQTLKKNKNNRGLVYNQKSSPVRKPYIIKNKRK